ncbi:hypothetical protein [Protofrankia symbiont of Coriaria ruscifolia]|uniref:Uncharacterized protein n=1 Tax=Candidatus Protofrankia californiensis TaxID=1839754 RepID=A0A1C3P2Q4_9ACTN|nr:hypothetical protein [Protofrankia symbiont of Coriaria ruscifolia]SBW24066.1 hypothetical protein FDG2_4001 [Candidatus Protofrankia californiensis]
MTGSDPSPPSQQPRPRATGARAEAPLDRAEVPGAGARAELVPDRSARSTTGTMSTHLVNIAHSTDGDQQFVINDADGGLHTQPPDGVLKSVHP